MNILIADDHGIVRQGLKSFLEQQANMQVVGEAENGQAAVQLAKELLPEIILMDISMPVLNGVVATQRILGEDSQIKIIALSMHMERHFVVETLKAGALGYVLKRCLFDEVLDAINTVAVNKYYLSPQITNLVIEDYINKTAAATSSEVQELTERELQIIKLITEGQSTKQVALHLHISPKTADAARRRIMKKLDISSIAELTKYAISKGLTTVS